MKTLALLLLLTPAAFAGSFAGNPADEPDPAQDSAWFLGQRSIRWCAADSALASPFQEAFSRWRTYLNARAPALAEGEPLLALQMEQLAACDGSEDLRLDSGAGPARAERLNYDPRSGWGKGRITADPAAVHLLPELVRALGSVFGCGPAPGTILAAGASLESAEIDRAQELLPMPALSLDLTRSQSPLSALNRLGGVRPGVSAPFPARLQLAQQDKMIKGELSRPEGIYRVELDPAFRPLRLAGTKLLKKYLRNSLFFQSAEARLYSGSVTTPTGLEIPAILKLDLGKAVELDIFQDGSSLPLFVVDSYAD
jgi:hypothetical protein